MTSHNTQQRLTAGRRAIAEQAVYANTLVRVACDRCGELPVNQRTQNGAIDHVRVNPGHRVTTHVLQAVTYSKPEDGS